MKKRIGFVSNSSSSSFVIVDASSGYESLGEDESMTFGPDKGEYEFGWGIYDVKDIWSRINFAYIQTYYANPEQDALLEKAREIVYGRPGSPFLRMLEDVIRKNSNIKEILWGFNKDDDDDCLERGYIDHQSSAAENQNMEIFESEEKLRDFIFGKGSYIHLDNDNHP